MKKLVILLSIVLVSIKYSAAQEDPYSDVLQELEDTSAVITDDSEEGISIEMDEVVKEVESDTTKIKFGKKDITIYDEEDGSTSLNIRDDDEDNDWDQDWEDDDSHVNKKKFKGHWAGIEMGFNNFVDNEYSLTRNPANQFMDLNTGRSWNVNLNFHQSSFRLIGSRFGLVTGLGLEFNNYFFDGNNSVIKDVNGVVVDSVFARQVSKSKLAATYLDLPILFELQIGKGKRSNRINIIAGVIGGVKLGSHTKIVYKDDKKREKNSDDFNISPLKIGLTARVGFSNVQVYGNYFLTSFFEKNKGPELYPISVGLSWSFL